MNVVAPFGFVTACHAGDKFMVRATLASIRHYCPKVPICLLADGDVEVNDLQHEYDLIVLRPRELPDKKMARLVSGNYRIKLAAMWEGPFEHYVWMDSDAIVWGDFTAQVRRDVDFQIFWSEVSIAADAVDEPGWLGHLYFDLKRLKQHDPKFEWRGWPYFSAGVYACRRNCFSFDEWQRVEGWNESAADPIFKFGEQGQLAYMVHAKAQRGQLRVECTDLQHIWLKHGKEELEADLADVGWSFPDRINRPRVAHFCGQKPYLHNMRAYAKPFTIARLEHHRREHGKIGAWFQLIKEETPIVAEKILRRCRKLWRRMVNR